MRLLLEAPLDDPGWRALARALVDLGADVRVVHRGAGDAASVPDADRAWLAARAGDDRAPRHRVCPEALRAWGIAAPRVRADWRRATPNGADPSAPVEVAAVLTAPGQAGTVARAWCAAGAPAGARLVMVAGEGDLDPVAEVLAAVDPERMGDATLVAAVPVDGGRDAAGRADVVIGDGAVAREAAAAGAIRLAAAPDLTDRLAETLAAGRGDDHPDRVARAVRDRMAGARVVPASRTPPARRPLVAITGDVTAATSLGALTRGLARGLLARGDVEVALIPEDPGTLAGDPAVAALLAAAPPPRRAPDLTVRNGHPPVLDRAATGRQVHWLHWEFGAPPRAWLEGAVLAADEVWVDSPYARDGFTAAGLDPARVAVVSPGVDPALLRPGRPTADLGEAAPGTRFLFVGGLVERKGADLLLDAYARAFGRDDDVTLVVKRVGAGGAYARTDADDRAERMAADPGGPRVRIADGAVTDDAIASLYAACHCLVHPYRGEAFGMTMLEAMACGLPVIAPDRGAARLFMDAHTARLVPARRRVLPTLADGEGRALTGAPVVHECDPGDLARAMRRVHDDRAAALRLGLRASSRVHARHTWAHTAARAAGRIHALLGTATHEAAV